jgi:3-phenylpropionate/cinnamic acid dioxygenase small subunit
MSAADDAAARPLLVAEPLRREIEAFLYLEARLADESQYGEWEKLLADEMHYWVPKGAADYDPAEQLSYINDNRARLATRLRQLRTGLRHAQTPVSPMRRIVSNIEILAVDEIAGTFTVASNFVLYELAVQSGSMPLRVWPGRITHRLRRIDGELRMTQKIVELVTASVPQSNMAFLI